MSDANVLAVDDELVRSFDVVHIDEGAPSSREERVAHEEPLQIRVNGASLAVLMRTPGDDLDLVRGFVVTERIANAAQIESVRHCTTAPDPEAEDNVVDVVLSPMTMFEPTKHARHTFASSSCGVCGKATIENACALAPPIDDDAWMHVDTLAALPATLRASQRAFDATGGVHGAALFDPAGNVIAAREDVGRHNAVDKVVGASLAIPARQVSLPPANGMPVAAFPRVTTLLVSGRVSFEIVQKAAAARIPIVAGISAPSSLAVRMARALNVTVVGFLRGSSMNVYSATKRVVSNR